MYWSAFRVVAALIGFTNLVGAFHSPLHGYACDPTPTLHESNQTEQEMYASWKDSFMASSSREIDLLKDTFSLIGTRLRYPKIWTNSHAEIWANDQVWIDQDHSFWNWNTSLSKLPCDIVIRDHWIFEHHDFFPDNYGHFLHDHMPAIAFSRKLLHQGSKILTQASPLGHQFLSWLEPEFLSEIIFAVPGQVVCIPGILTGYILRPHHLLHQTTAFHQWLHSIKPRPINRDVVIYYSRSSPTVRHRRKMGQKQESQIISEIRKQISLNNWSVSLIIFTGESEDGSLMSFGDQFDLFSRAILIVGPHGSGMTNILYVPAPDTCRCRTQVIEFTGGPRSEQVQHAIFGKTYWYLESLAPWVQYHHLLFSPESTPSTTTINMNEFERAIELIFRQISTACPDLIHNQI